MVDHHLGAVLMKYDTLPLYYDRLALLCEIIFFLGLSLWPLLVQLV